MASLGCCQAAAGAAGKRDDGGGRPNGPAGRRASGADRRDSGSWSKSSPEPAGSAGWIRPGWFFSARDLGLAGYELQERMYREAGTSLEMADHENVIAVVTWGNRPEDLDRLIKGAESIARAEAGKRQPLLRRNFQFSDLPEMAIPPREAYSGQKEKWPGGMRPERLPGSRQRRTRRGFRWSAPEKCWNRTCGKNWSGAEGREFPCMVPLRRSLRPSASYK